MKTLFGFIAAAGLAVSLPQVASAQAFQTINSRQANQFARIQQGVRNGALTAAEAASLKSQFYALARLEQRYRVGGLSGWERNDLNTRFNNLSRRIFVQKHDRQAYFAKYKHY